MSLRARIARIVARVSTKRPIARAVGRPDFVARYRAVLGQMSLSFGRLPRGAIYAAVDEAISGHAVRGEWIFAAREPRARSVIYYLHGGGYIACSPAQYRSLTGALALRCGARVFALDYRLAPEHRYPAALDDALAGFDWLLAHGIDAREIVVGGDSAGGGLALALMLALRDRGTLPAAAFLLSPWVDLAGTGASIIENAYRDDVVVRDGSTAFARLYAGDLPLDDPRVSGLYGDLRGLPPLLVQASRIEMLRDDAVRLVERASAAGTDAHLELFDGVHHVWQLFTGLPESHRALKNVAAFTGAALAGITPGGQRHASNAL